MIQNTEQAKNGGIPRLAMINSFAGYGRCSTTISLPVVSVMKVQGCPVPTSILSNHLGFPTCYFDDYTNHMKQYLQAWKQLDAAFDGLYCGFLGSTDQISVVKEFLESPSMRCRQAQPLFLLDPVMGDHGRTYSSITKKQCEAMKELAALADILTPNITEACILTDTPYKEGPWTNEELFCICEKLSAKKADRQRSLRIVITGLLENDRILNYIWEDQQCYCYYSLVAGAPHHGTGDLYASILAADALHGVPFVHSVKKAADFVALCIRGTEEAGTPKQDGVLFEKYLHQLCQ